MSPLGPESLPTRALDEVLDERDREVDEGRDLAVRAGWDQLFDPIEDDDE